MSEQRGSRLRRIHDKSCLLYDYDPRLTKGLDEAAACRCPAVTPHDCGHAETVRGCGGCDPGAIDFVITDTGLRRPFDPALDMQTVPTEEPT